MTWGRQVLHVVAKDLRQWRLIYGVYVAIVLATTVYAVVPNLSDSALQIAGLFVVTAGMVVAAMVVQGDSPMRADAFWASRPLQSSAVANAKAVQALVIIAIPLVGQAIGLVSHGIAAESLPHYLSPSIGIFGLWIAAALVSAALTKNVSSAIVAFIVVSIMFGLVEVAAEFAPALSPLTHISVGAAQCAAAVSIVFFMYARRVRSMGVAALGGLVMIAPWMMLLPDTKRVNDAVGPIRSTLHVEFADPRTVDSSSLPLHLWIDGLNSSQRVTIHNATVSLTLRSGRTIDVARYDIPLSQGDSVPMSTQLKWLGSRAATTAQNKMLVPLHLQPEERALVAGGIRKVSVSGFLTVMEPRVIDTLTLRKGTQRRTHDQRILVSEASFNGDDVRLVLHVSGPTPGSGQEALPFDPYMTNAPHFALVNEKRGEAVPISGSNMMSRNSWLVMPGVTISDQTFNLSLRNPPVAATVLAATNNQPFASVQMQAAQPVPLNVDGPWLRDASLVLLEWRMKARYPITGSVLVQ